MDKRNVTIICVCAVTIVVVLAATYLALRDDGSEDSDRTMEAVEMLENGDYQGFYDRSDATLRSAVGGVKGLEAMWNQYTYGIGDFEKVERTESVQSGLNTITNAYCKHSEWGLVLTITFGFDSSYVGLFFGYYEPEGVDPFPSDLIESDATVDAGTGYPLPGTLTSSVTSEHDIAVVVVHGSGPNDRDGTIGANKLP